MMIFHARRNSALGLLVLQLACTGVARADGRVEKELAARYPEAAAAAPFLAGCPLLASVLATERVWELEPDALRARVMPDEVVLQQGSKDYPLLFAARASSAWHGAPLWRQAAYEVEYYCFDVARPCIKLHIGRPLNALWHNEPADPEGAKRKAQSDFPPLPDSVRAEIRGNIEKVVEALKPYGAEKLPFAHPKIVKYRLPGGTRLSLSDFSGSLGGSVYLEIVLEPIAPVESKSRLRLPAFPGAEGYGALTAGGRGGKVYVVTSLADYLPRGRAGRPAGKLGQPADPPPGYDPEKWLPYVDAKGVESKRWRRPVLPAIPPLPREQPIPGTLREAIEAEGPRTVVFAVSGTIELKSTLVVTNPYLTVVGNTAPGQGIQIRNWGLDVRTHDVILRFLRIRVGDIKGPGDMPRVLGEQTHALDLDGLNIIVDHCEFAFANDQIVNFYGHDRRVGISFQWNYVYGGLLHSTHEKGAHSMSYIMDGWGYVSMHHNLTAHTRTRNPRAWGVHLDYRNNVLYDFGKSGYGNANDYLKMNYVGNVVKRGPKPWGFQSEGPFAEFYAADNWLPDGSQGGLNVDRSTLMPHPWDSVPITTSSAKDAYERVLEFGGACLPARDVVSAYVVRSTRENTGKIPQTPSDFPMGGFPSYPRAALPEPLGSDGIPSSWKRKYGLDVGVPGSLPKDGGYTLLEMYLYGIDPTRKVDWRAPANNVDPLRAAVQQTTSR